MSTFCVDWGGASLVQAGAKRPSPLRGALKTRRYSELNATPLPPKKNYISPFFDASGKKNIGATIRIG